MMATFVHKTKGDGKIVIADRIDLIGIQIIASLRGESIPIAWINVGGDWIAYGDEEAYQSVRIEGEPREASTNS